MQPEGGATENVAPPPALAYWLSAQARTVVRAAAQQHALSAPDAPPALRGALIELDAAAIRSRWFDHPAAGSFRRIAGHAADTVTLRLSAAEHAALIACDPDVVSPLLEDDTHPTRPVPAASAPPEPIAVPSGQAGPVIVLDHDGINLRWALAEYDGATLSVRQTTPDDGTWTIAYENTRQEPVDIEVQDAARRLVAKSHPALSTLALARTELRPAPGEAVLLRLPDIVVIAPAQLAARVVAYTAPIPVVSVRAEVLPAEPSATTAIS